MSERDMQALIALLERRLGVQWTDVVQWLRDQNAVSQLEEKLVTGRLDEVIADVQTAAQKFASDLHGAFVTAAQREAAFLDSQVDDALIHYDATMNAVVARARANTLELVQGLTAEAQVNIHQALVDRARTGESPRTTAQRIRNGLGLTPDQDRAVARYRQGLEEQDWSRVLGYELSDGNADRTIRRLQRDGGSLTAAQVDDFTEKYRQNRITSRAETIARTEGLRNAHEGGRDAIRQAIDRGDVDPDQLEKEWHAAPKTKYAREDHQEMNGKTVGVLEDFVLPDGTHMSGPGDPRGGAKHCAGCRCCDSVTFR